MSSRVGMLVGVLYWTKPHCNPGRQSKQRTERLLFFRSSTIRLPSCAIRLPDSTSLPRPGCTCDVWVCSCAQSSVYGLDRQALSEKRDRAMEWCFMEIV